jgi:hypothetical protein
MRRWRATLYRKQGAHPTPEMSQGFPRVLGGTGSCEPTFDTRLTNGKSRGNGSWGPNADILEWDAFAPFGNGGLKFSHRNDLSGGGRRLGREALFGSASPASTFALLPLAASATFPPPSPKLASFSAAIPAASPPPLPPGPCVRALPPDSWVRCQVSARLLRIPSARSRWIPCRDGGRLVSWPHPPPSALRCPALRRVFALRRGFPLRRAQWPLASPGAIMLPSTWTSPALRAARVPSPAPGHPIAPGPSRCRLPHRPFRGREPRRVSK